MKNVKYLKEHNLYKAHEHFMRLAEAYPSLPEESLYEDDPMDGDDNGGMQGGDMPDQGEGMDSMGGDPSGMGGGNDAMGMDAAGGGQDMGGMPGADGAQADVGSMPPAGGGMDDMPDIGGDEDEDNGEDDGETIDINGLTKAEERLNVKQNQLGRDMSKIDGRIEKLMRALDSFQSAVDNNNKELEDLRAEFEKRNPTETERLNLRSLDSYPFNIKPTDYWKDKAARGGYEAYADNSEPTTKEYVITNNDVDDVDDNILNTFFTPDEDDIQTFEKIFKL